MHTKLVDQDRLVWVVHVACDLDPQVLLPHRCHATATHAAGRRVDSPSGIIRRRLDPPSGICLRRLDPPFGILLRGPDPPSGILLRRPPAGILCSGQLRSPPFGILLVGRRRRWRWRDGLTCLHVQHAD